MTDAFQVVAATGRLDRREATSHQLWMDPININPCSWAVQEYGCQYGTHALQGQTSSGTTKLRLLKTVSINLNDLLMFD
jgi:hypothetical protein